MKQGRASSNVTTGQKVEPKSHAVSIDRTAAIGIKEVRTQQPNPLMKGPGFKAASNGAHMSKSGSQGKHK